MNIPLLFLLSLFQLLHGEKADTSETGASLLKNLEKNAPKDNFEINSRRRGSEEIDRSGVSELQQLNEEVRELQREHARLRSSNENEEADVIERKIQDKMEELHTVRRKDAQRRPDVDDRLNRMHERGGGRDPDNMRAVHEEIRTLQKQYGELRKTGNHEEAEEIQTKIKEKLTSMHEGDRHFRRDRFKDMGRNGGEDLDLPDHIRGRMDGRGDGRGRGREDIEKEMFNRHAEMNRHRVDEMIRRAESAGFPKDEELQIKREIEEYFDLEQKLLVRRTDEQKAFDRIREENSGDREAALEIIRVKREEARENEKEMREAVRDKRRDIESKIREQMRGHEF